MNITVDATLLLAEIVAIIWFVVMVAKMRSFNGKAGWLKSAWQIVSNSCEVRAKKIYHKD